MIIFNATIHTLDQNNTVIENGFIAFDEKIQAIGKVDTPEYTKAVSQNQDSLQFDAKGKVILPGFVDAHTHVGVWGNAEGVEGDDGNETTDPCTPHLRALDMVNPTDYCFSEALKAGVTTVMCGPGSANPIGGQFIAMKTAGSSRIDNRIIKSPAAMKFAFGENPKMVYRERGETPNTRMATAALIREQLFKAVRYLEAIQKSEEDPDCEPPEYDIKCEALLPVLRKEIPVHAHAHRADDIFSAIRIAEEFDLKLTILHGTESGEITDELKMLDVPFILGPVICDRSKPELSGHTIDTAGMLFKNGIRFAIATDHPVVPIQYLPLSTGLTIRAGLPTENALRKITIEAAEICGLDDRVGSLELGKDADIIVFDREQAFYDVLAVPEKTFINGKEFET
ncbi:MAG: amidohydrolase [Oscillospiraceae bacterium]|nr:amidohydrolase [Oscillospiraceae bacterium]